MGREFQVQYILLKRSQQNAVTAYLLYIALCNSAVKRTLAESQQFQRRSLKLLIIDRLKTLRKSITTMQREGQARQGCLSVCAQSFARMQTKKAHADPRSTKSEWDSAVLEGRCGGCDNPSVLRQIRLRGY